MDISASVQRLLLPLVSTQDADKHVPEQSRKNDQRSTGCEWTAGETKLLFDYYEQYFAEIGPLKKFKNKKLMFSQIAADITEALGVPKSEQCCSRYKTVMRRKRSATADNNKSGNSPCEVPFEDEVARIRWLDDSLEPEELRDSSGVVAVKRPVSQASASPASTSQESDSPASTSQASESQESESLAPSQALTKEPMPKRPKPSGSRMLEMKVITDSN
ncbi:uncharacterized protein LOC142584488 [Dermacentor variabilis]|uniref:uncharacterized protein LOC142584488 n=1 Tax=Dermacentor variabilis TaxID=34621 RepID=UPI003F5B8D5D